MENLYDSSYKSATGTSVLSMVMQAMKRLLLDSWLHEVGMYVRMQL